MREIVQMFYNGGVGCRRFGYPDRSYSLDRKIAIA